MTNTDNGGFMTPAQIAELTGKARSTVSNWRRRHPDFPQPAAGSEDKPLYARADILRWLVLHEIKTKEPTAEQLLDGVLADLQMDSVDLLPAAIEILAQEAQNNRRGKPSVGGTDRFSSSIWRQPEQLPRETKDRLSSRLGELNSVADPEVLLERAVERFDLWSPVRASANLVEAPLLDLLLDLVIDERATSILDPACGTGTLLLGAARRDPGLRLVGVENGPSWPPSHNTGRPRPASTSR